MQKGKNNSAAVIISWTLTAICMGIIFWLSSRTSAESATQSGFVLKLLQKIFGDNVFTTFIVRKSAHCLEFTGLSLLFNISFYTTKNKPSCFWATVSASAYAVTDEIHQLFVEGRSCQIGDWAIDTAGAVLGTLGFFIIFSAVKAIFKRKKTRTEIKSFSDLDRENN